MTAGAAAMAEAVVIEAARPRENAGFDLAQIAFLDSFQCVYGLSLESLEKTLFPFASARGLKYR